MAFFGLGARIVSGFGAEIGQARAQVIEPFGPIDRERGARTMLGQIVHLSLIGRGHLAQLWARKRLAAVVFQGSQGVRIALVRPGIGGIWFLAQDRAQTAGKLDVGVDNHVMIIFLTELIADLPLNREVPLLDPAELFIFLLGGGVLLGQG